MVVGTAPEWMGLNHEGTADGDRLERNGTQHAQRCRIRGANRGAEEIRVMTFVEKHRFAGGRTEDALLKTSWEGEIFGVGMMEQLAKRYPEHAGHATACATMEWFNVHRCEEFGDETGVYVTLEQAEKLGREGAELVRKHSFTTVAKMTAAETPAADKMYEELAKVAKNPELRAFAGHLDDQENALRDWLKSELDGKSDGAEKVFA
jgi:hypothetical protein